jgi:hypothetical protein
MARVWRCLGQYDAETTTYSALAVAGFTSPYTPDFNGQLIGLRAIPNRSAATSLINHIEFKLTCASFNPNTIEIGCQGTGLQTAPALMDGFMDWGVDQPVIAGVPITIEARNVTADTPVTVSALLYGLFNVK